MGETSATLRLQPAFVAGSMTGSLFGKGPADGKALMLEEGHERWLAVGRRFGQGNRGDERRS
jgi:hypothetical protein